MRMPVVVTARTASVITKENARRPEKRSEHYGKRNVSEGGIVLPNNSKNLYTHEYKK